MTREEQLKVRIRTIESKSQRRYIDDGPTSVCSSIRYPLECGHYTVAEAAVTEIERLYTLVELNMLVEVLRFFK